ncbi:MAG: ABC-2 family transporter protein [Deltaproteobacteria bacterium]|nr:ABC-2 family transporter protein [Deltaproteobacteria bacterium]
MTAYGAIFSARFQVLLQYRSAAMAGAVTQLFFGLVRVMMLGVFYDSVTSPQPMSYPDVVTYIWLGQALLLLAMFRADAEVSEMIQSGSVLYELVRPIGLYRLWLCRAVASRTAPTLLRLLPVLVVAGLFFGLKAPDSILSAGLFAISLTVAILLSSALVTILTISLLWTISGQGINHLAPSVVMFFSGLIVPLPLFPGWAQSIIAILPFRGLADLPFRIYMGHIPPPQAVLAILHQMVWTGVLVLFGSWLLTRAVRKLVVQGG